MKTIALIFSLTMAGFAMLVNSIHSPEWRYNEEHNKQVYTITSPTGEDMTFRVMLLQPEELELGWTIADEVQLKAVIAGFAKSGYTPTRSTVIVSSSAHIEVLNGHKTVVRDVYRCVDSKGTMVEDTVPASSLRQTAFVPASWRILAVKQRVEDLGTIAASQ